MYVGFVRHLYGHIYSFYVPYSHGHGGGERDGISSVYSRNFSPVSDFFYRNGYSILRFFILLPVEVRIVEGRTAEAGKGSSIDVSVAYSVKRARHQPFIVVKSLHWGGREGGGGEGALLTFHVFLFRGVFCVREEGDEGVHTYLYA